MDLAKNRLLAASTALVAAAMLAAALASTADAVAPKPFGHACSAQDGVRFCPTSSTAQRVPTWDGVPLDADVTLPAQGKGPFPTIVMLHGWGGGKADFESSKPEGDGSTRVTLEQEQKLRGMARLGGVMVRRAARRALDGALEGLESLHAP